jgi:ATP-dependent Lon protease
MKMHFVDTMDQVLKIALEGPLPQILEETRETTITPIAPQAGESPATHQ